MDRVLNVTVGQDRAVIVGNAPYETLVLPVRKVGNCVELQ